jgi:hypothetical protein
MQFLFSEPTLSYCELPGGHILARPGYVLSNLSIIAVGLYLLMRKNSLSKNFGGLSILAGLMSLIYDASYVFISQLFDLLAMVTLSLFVLSLNLKRLGNKKGISIVERLLIILISGCLIITFKGMTGNVIFVVLILLVAITELKIAGSKKSGKFSYVYWFIPSALMLAGLFIWIVDYTKLWCDPKNIFNGRAIYHYLASVSIYFYYLFYKQFNIENYS